MKGHYRLFIPLVQAYFPLKTNSMYSPYKEKRILVIFLIVVLLNFSWFQGFKVIKNIITTLGALFVSD